MRITNSMIMNNARTNINSNKFNVDKASNMVDTQKKISRPSEDPIIAVRALRLRNDLNEVNQYYEKNVEDADSWMDLTETSLSNMRTAIKSMYDCYMRGANGYLDTSDGKAIIDEITALRDEIGSICNSTNAGRYIFTGYKTSTKFTLDAPDTSMSYEIRQGFTGKDIETMEYVSGISDFDKTNITGVAESNMPQSNEVYRLSLGYQKLEDLQEFTYVDGSGATRNINVTTYDLDTTNADAAYLNVAAGGANYIKDTGELILSKEVYNALANLQQSPDGTMPISVTYRKTGFEKGDARPEMHYDCKDLVSGLEYKKEVQDISYTINFNQKLNVNTEISNVIGRDMARNIDDVINAIQRVESAQDKVDEIQGMIDSKKYSGADLENLESSLESAEKELELQKKVYMDIMGKGVGQTQDYEAHITEAIADVGNRMSRLNLMKERLGEQQSNFKELKSQNENVELSDALLELTAAKLAYESALSATGQISQLSLLNYL